MNSALQPPDWRALCEDLFADYEQHLYRSVLADRVRNALAQPEPEVVGEPTDQELLELMPETMRDEFSYAAKACSNAAGGQVKPGIFRVCLNTAALEYARAVLARWGGSCQGFLDSSASPVPAGEVGELVAWLRERGKAIEQCSLPIIANYFIQAADLIDQQRQVAPVHARDLIQAYQAGRRDAEADAQQAVKVAEDRPTGEVAELVTWLRSTRAARLTRAAELLEQRQTAPVLVAPYREVADLVVWLEDHSAECLEIDRPEWSKLIAKAAKFLHLYLKSVPVPVSINERLPGPEDCDVEGKCWWWDGEWGLIEQRFTDYNITHWLPAHALPLPSGKVE